MKALILNGSPRKSGHVATMLQQFAKQLKGYEITYVDVYELNMRPCTACMRCRTTGQCCLPQDDAHRMAQAVDNASILVVGSPDHWGNMSTALKMLFDRLVPVFIAEGNRAPIPKQKGKIAVLLNACTTPAPFHMILRESRGTFQAIAGILRYGGYKIAGKIAFPGTKSKKILPENVQRKIKRIAKRVSAH